jgi:hypothetical protein
MNHVQKSMIGSSRHAVWRRLARSRLDKTRGCLLLVGGEGECQPSSSNPSQRLVPCRPSACGTSSHSRGRWIPECQLGKASRPHRDVDNMATLSLVCLEKRVWPINDEVERRREAPYGEAGLVQTGLIGRDKGLSTAVDFEGNRRSRPEGWLRRVKACGDNTPAFWQWYPAGQWSKETDVRLWLAVSQCGDKPQVKEPCPSQCCVILVGQVAAHLRRRWREASGLSQATNSVPACPDLMLWTALRPRPQGGCG